MALLGLRAVKICALTAAIAMSAAWAAGQGARPATTLVEPPAPLLPTSDVLVASTGIGGMPADVPATQAVLKEDGLRRQDSRSIVPAGKSGGWVAAYEFSDATGAFAAFTYFRLGGKPVTHGVNESEVVKPDGEVVFLSGTSVVRARGAESLLKTVDAGLPKITGRRAQIPLLPSLLPARGLDRGSLRYALGPVGYTAMGGVLEADDLGWDKSAEVATAGYDGKGQLTLLLYPTPQIAGDRGRAIQNDVNAAGPAKFGTIKMRRVGPLVGVTSGGLSDAQAIDLVGALKLNEEVTFDKKMPLEFHAEVRKTYTLLQSIAVFCGISILASVVLAVFLGGARAGIRVLQGKPAASEPEFLTIDLRAKPASLLGDPGKPKEQS